MKNQQQFKTDNFPLSCYLLCVGCRILSVDKTNPRRAVFVFDETDDLKLHNQKFLSYETLIEPHKFFSAQKDIKQLIYGV